MTSPFQRGRTCGLWLAALAAGAPLAARLEFSPSTQVVKATAADRVLTATYAFTNTGSAPVAFVDVSTSCGCLVATVEKKLLAPGETGTVAARYTIGPGEGTQVQRVHLLTNEAAENRYTLIFQAELPRAMQAPLPPAAPVSPLFLHWAKQPFEVKRVSVDLASAHAVEFSATCTPAEAFTIKTVTEPDGKRATIEVTPTESGGRAPGELLVSLTTENGAVVQHRVILRVLAGRRP